MAGFCKREGHGGFEGSKCPQCCRGDMTKKANKSKHEQSANKLPSGPPWTWPNGHYHVKVTGFQVEDGKVFVAPCVRDRFDRNIEEQEAVQAWIDAHNHYVNRRFLEMERARKHAWEYACGELGIEPGDHELIYIRGAIYPKPNEDKA